MPVKSADILTIKAPERLFSNDVAVARKEFHDLSKLWHPDRCHEKDASQVFQHIQSLYKEALRKINHGVWEMPNLLTLKTKHGVEHLISYKTKHDFEFGQMYVGSNHVTYIMEKEHKDFLNNAVRVTKSFKYANPKMESEVSRYLPGQGATLELSDSRLGLQVPKTPDLLLLRDVVRFYDNKVDPKHVAWIQSTIHNLLCYLSFAELTHNNISPDTYFISPKHHSGALLGGWWFAKKVGSKLEKVPRRTASLLPWDVQTSKLALPITDLELTKATGRETVGDVSLAPKNMKSFLTTVTSEKSVDAYKNWGTVLKSDFGARRFTEMDLDETKLYK